MTSIDTRTMPSPSSGSHGSASGAARLRALASVRSDRQGGFALGIAVIGVLVIASFLVPFTLLRGVDAWYGSFLFWSVATAVVITISAVISGRWKD